MFLPPCEMQVAPELKCAFQNHPPALPPLYLFTYTLIKSFSKFDPISLAISAPLEAVEFVTDQKAASSTLAVLCVRHVGDMAQIKNLWLTNEFFATSRAEKSEKLLHVRYVWPALMMVESGMILVDECWLKNSLSLDKRTVQPRGKRDAGPCAQVPMVPFYYRMVFPHSWKVPHLHET